MKRIVAIFFALIMTLAGCAGGGETNGATWQEQYDLGVRYLSEGNYEEAIIAFTAAIGIEPMNEDAYYQLAQIYLERMDYPAAEEILKQGIDQMGGSRLERSFEALQKIYADAYTLTIKNITPEYGTLKAYHLVDTEGWAKGQGAEIKSGGIVSREKNYVSFEVEDVADGYRVKSILWNGEDRTTDWIYGGDMGCAFYVEEDIEIELTMEAIPNDLPEVPHATIADREEDGFGRVLVAILDSEDFPEDKVNYVWEYREPDSDEWVTIWFWSGYKRCRVAPFGGQEVDLVGKHVRLTVQGREGFSTGYFTTEEYYVPE